MAATSTLSIIERNADGTIHKTIHDSQTNLTFAEDGYSAARKRFGDLRSCYVPHDGRVLVLVLNGADVMQEPMLLKERRKAREERSLGRPDPKAKGKGAKRTFADPKSRLNPGGCAGRLHRNPSSRILGRVP